MPYTAMQLKLYDQFQSYGFCKLVHSVTGLQVEVYFHSSVSSKAMALPPYGPFCVGLFFLSNMKLIMVAYPVQHQHEFVAGAIAALLEW